MVTEFRTGAGVDYAAALTEAGFDRSWVAQGEERIDEYQARQLYLTFGSSVVRPMLAAAAPTSLPPPELDAIIRRVEAEEKAARLDATGRCLS